MDLLATYARGIAIGLALFVAWAAAIFAVCLAAIYIEYWIWAIFPAAFIVFGITLTKDRAAALRARAAQTTDDGGSSAARDGWQSAASAAFKNPSFEYRAPDDGDEG